MPRVRTAAGTTNIGEVVDFPELNTLSARLIRAGYDEGGAQTVTVGEDSGPYIQELTSWAFFRWENRRLTPAAPTQADFPPPDTATASLQISQFRSAA